MRHRKRATAHARCRGCTHCWIFRHGAGDFLPAHQSPHHPLFSPDKTGGSPNIDEGLAAYDYITTHQPGAEHAPYYFVSGYPVQPGHPAVYSSLAMPVWMVHGTRGDFVDYTNKGLVEDRPNWTIQVFETGAMPYFEVEAAFVRAYDAFLAGATAASPA